jgi:hypothetical protein
MSEEPSSRRSPIVVAEHAAEPDPTRDLAFAVVVAHPGYRPDDLTVQSFVVPLAMIVNNEFAQ